ncbi:MAG: phytanoyl-CoA dioxygenase family protein [Pseudomonadota bacterium]
MLNQDDITRFNTQGFLVVEDLLEDSLLTRIRAEYAELLDQLYGAWHDEGRVPAPKGLGFEEKLSAAYRAGCDWFQPMDISLPNEQITPQTPMHFGPAVFDMVVHERILDCVEALIGPEITSCPIQHVRIKPPAPQLSKDEVRAHVGQTDWHQDRAVALQEADQTDMVTVWLAITDATEENGCLQVAPNLAEGMLPHCPKRQTAIADGFVEEANAVPLPVKAGGALLLHPLLPHSSRPNHSTGFRWSFDLRYSRTGQPTGRAQFPDFIARSRATPQAELRDWRAWRTLWEEARLRLSTTPHIEQHRWQSDAPFCA